MNKTMHLLFALLLGYTFCLSSFGQKTETKRKKTETKSVKSSYRIENEEYYNGHKILTGPRGGKYYINKNGNKTYIKH